MGTHEGIEIDLEFKHDVIPFYDKPYNIPVSLQLLVKKAINELCEQGVLIETTEDTECATPTFCVPKKTVGVRIITYHFRRCFSARDEQII